MSDAQTANTNVRQESPAERLLTPVQFVRGVGPQRAELLKNLGILTARDLLFHVPTGINDFSDVRTVPKLEADVEQSVHGFVVDRAAAVDKEGSFFHLPIAARCSPYHRTSA